MCVLLRKQDHKFETLDHFDQLSKLLRGQLLKWVSKINLYPKQNFKIPSRKMVQSYTGALCMQQK